MFRKVRQDVESVASVSIILDGAPVSAELGESIAAVLLRTAPFTNRRSPVSGASRSPFCMMGACFDCLVEIDGRSSSRACLTRARDGMIVNRQIARPDPLRDVPA